MQKNQNLRNTNPVDEIMKSGIMVSASGSSDAWFNNWMSSFKSDWSALEFPAFAKAQQEIAIKQTALKTVDLQMQKSDGVNHHTFSHYEEENRDLPENTIVIIPVRGIMVREETWMTRYGYATSTLFLERISKQLDADENVIAIIFDCNSGGGLGYGNQRLSKTIAGLSTTTVLFYQNCASAALESFKSCDYIIANEDDAKIGSYGSYVSFTFLTDEGLKEWGYKQVIVYAPQSTEKNIESREAKEGNTEKMEEMLRKSVDFMIADMNEQRPLQSKEWETGKLFNGKEAIEIGLTDQILSMDETIDFLRKILPEPAEKNSFQAMVNFQ